jgi:hypothetical protein
VPTGGRLAPGETVGSPMDGEVEGEGLRLDEGTLGETWLEPLLLVGVPPDDDGDGDGDEWACTDVTLGTWPFCAVTAAAASLV